MRISKRITPLFISFTFIACCLTFQADSFLPTVNTFNSSWIIGDIEAMEYNQPAELYIDCLEDSEVILFNKDCLYRADLPKEQIIENVQLLSRRIGRLQRRVLLLMGAPAVDRYKYFIEIYPDLSSRLPQRMIASYLGIAPQTLSTLRSKMAHSK